MSDDELWAPPRSSAGRPERASPWAAGPDLDPPPPPPPRPEPGDGPAPAAPAVGEQTLAAAPVARRRFVGRAGAFVAGLAAGGAGVGTVVATWLRDDGPARVALGPLPDLLQAVAAGPVGLDGGRAYAVAYPPAAIAAAAGRYDDAVLAGMRYGVAVLSMACTHQGCRVPFCPSSGWFECPCHVARFDALGELRTAVAPRGLDHHPVEVGPALEVRYRPDVRLAGASPGPPVPGLADPAGPFCV